MLILSENTLTDNGMTKGKQELNPEETTEGLSPQGTRREEVDCASPTCSPVLR